MKEIYTLEYKLNNTDLNERSYTSLRIFLQKKFNSIMEINTKEIKFNNGELYKPECSYLWRARELCLLNVLSHRSQAYKVSDWPSNGRRYCFQLRRLRPILLMLELPSSLSLLVNASTYTQTKIIMTYKY